MKNQPGVYYSISSAMIIIGFLMLTNFFELNTAQMNAINIGAALITLSTAIVGLVSFKKLNIWFARFSKLNLYFGVVLVFFGFLIRSFKEDLWLIKVFNTMDTNPLVLVCLGITIGSIVLIENYNKKNGRKLNDRIKELEKENAAQNELIKQANSIIQSSFGGKKNE